MVNWSLKFSYLLKTLREFLQQIIQMGPLLLVIQIYFCLLMDYDYRNENIDYLNKESVNISYLKDIKEHTRYMILQ